MTAINAFADANGAYLMCDTAAYRADGRVTNWVNKAVLMPHLGFAFAMTGTLDAAGVMTDLLSKFSSFEDLMERGGATIKAAWDDDDFYFSYRDPELVHFRLFVAGWVKSQACGGVFALSTRDEPGQEAFYLNGNSPLYLSPGRVAPQLDAVGVTINGALAPGLEPVDRLTRIIDLQRKQETRDTEDQHPFVVGGHAIFTQVGENGIIQSTVRRWPDKIDELIDPTKDPEFVDVVTGMPAGANRHQRRALDRKNSKLKLV
jgi:hypothetical protein